MSRANRNTFLSESGVVSSQFQRLIVAIALAVLTGGAIALSYYGWRQSVLFIIGALLERRSSNNG